MKEFADKGAIQAEGIKKNVRLRDLFYQLFKGQNKKKTKKKKKSYARGVSEQKHFLLL